MLFYKYIIVVDMPKAKSKGPTRAIGTRRKKNTSQEHVDRQEGPVNTAGPSLSEEIKKTIEDVLPTVLPQYIPTIEPTQRDESAGSTAECISNKLVASANDDIGANISEKTKQEICNGEFVQFGKLLVKSIPNEEDSFYLVLKDGKLQSKQKPNTVNIDNISQWTDAFIVFMHVYLSAHPQDAIGMLKYMYTIRLGAKRVSGLRWKLYDEQFRMRKSKNTKKEWSTIDQELWLLYMYSDHDTGATSDLGRQNRAANTLKCYNYNNGFCNRNPCQYAHRCLKCSGFHPIKNCYANRTAQGNFTFRQGGQRDTTAQSGPNLRKGNPAATRARGGITRNHNQFN